MGTGGSIPGVNRQECEADRSPPTYAEVKKMWIYIYPLPHTLFFIIIWFARLLALRPLLAYCASFG
jgi:hypothetical protein